MKVQDPKGRMWTRWSSLKSERASWDGHWKELSTNLLPRNSRFFVSDRNRGQKRHNAIYDSTGTISLRTLAAGMMAGMTSPARPWFRLSLSDTDLLKSSPVQLYLADCTQLLLRIFAVSNVYRTLHSIYEELGAFGTAAAIVQPSFENVIHCTPLTVGEYALSVNGEGVVDTIFREFQKPVHALVREFGLPNVSQATKTLYDNGDYDKWVTVVHAVEPRLDRDASRIDPKNMPFKSCYFEQEMQGSAKYLRESGYKNFPALAPRWQVTAQDIYGSSPGMESLGDIKQLQHEQLRKAQAIDYQTQPPIGLPTAMKGQEIDTMPGGISYIDTASSQTGTRSLFDVRLDLNALLMDIQDVRSRIRSTFYADLFLMLASQPSTRMTATEVAERHEEKLLMLGPVLERLHNELLAPLIDMTWTRAQDAGILPPPPPELEGMELKVEFVSMLAQAQRAVATNSIDRFVGNLGAVAQIRPEVLDKFDADEWADTYSDMLGVPPKLLVDDQKVAAGRQARAEKQAAMEQQAATAASAEVAATAAGAASAAAAPGAQDIINQFSGYGSPSPQTYG